MRDFINIVAGGQKTIVIHDVVWEPHPEGLTIPCIDTLIVEGEDIDEQVRDHLVDQYGWPVVSFQWTVY